MLHGAAGIGKTSIAEMFKIFVMNRGRFSDGAYKVLCLGPNLARRASHANPSAQVVCQSLRVPEPCSFEDVLWDSISVALGTSSNIDAAFDTKV